MRPPDPEAWREARVLVVVAHPDDEVLGCGGLLARLDNGHVLHVTDGAPRDGADAARHGFADPPAYAAARRGEALAAMALAGLRPDRLDGLGIADQQVPRHLVAVTEALQPHVEAADVVLTHAYEGGHGDHDAVAFAVHAAHRRAAARALLIEMPFYHGDETGWVRQRFLPREGAGPELVHSLSPAERALKALMVAAHASQAATLAGFALDRELFRTAPSYDFAARPHAGPLLYERHGWSLTWAQWQGHVADAAGALGLAAWA